MFVRPRPRSAALVFVLALSTALPSIAFGQAASYPFTEDFETGTLAAHWQTTSTGTGRIQITGANVPNGGSFHAVMDSSVNGTYGLNEMVLTIDLAGQSGVLLGFFAKDFNDEPEALPVSFAGSVNGDGVSISTDGTNWYRVVDLATLVTFSYQQFIVDLDAVMTANGLTYNSTFQIKFQQYDNFAATTDGIAFDDILVQAATPPAITSTAVTAALAGSTYTYDVNATGLPAATYALTTSPAGMTINATTGVITWVPGIAEIPTSPHSVTVEATNSAGTDIQNFTVTVTGNPPNIITTGGTAAIAGSLYTYDVNATGNPAPTYSLTTSPAGMTINPTTGLITWVPGAADVAASPHAVTVVASNGLAPDDTENYSITVTGTPPTITTTGTTTATAGVQYTYDVNATGAPAPTYSLTTAPAGMTINPTTGLISWVPVEADIAASPHPVTVVAANGLTPDDTENFSITVSGAPPVITTTGVPFAYVGATYTYDVDAAAIPAATYSLSVAPAGMTIDATTGVITWTPTAADVGSNAVTVDATNGWTPDASESFTIDVDLPASFPFIEDFETGSLAGYWMTSSTLNGRIRVATTNTPNSGIYLALLDTTSGYALNEMVLAVDLQGQSGVFISFFAKDFGDEPEVLPLTFTGSVNGDGVSVSTDGTNWYRIVDLAGLVTGFYQPFTVDLDAFIAANGLTYTGAFLFKFQQYDNFAIATDGIAIDDVQIYSATAAPNMVVIPSADVVVSGPLGGPFSPPSAAFTVQNLGGGTVDFTASVDQPWVTLSPVSGSDSPPLPGIPVTATINMGADFLPVGLHTATVTFTNTTNGAGDTSRTILLIVDPPGFPTNDGFASATVIGGTSVNTTGWNVGATTETGEPSHAGNSGGASVWWAWTAPSDGTVTVSTAGSTIDTLLAVYTGTSVDTLTRVASNDNEASGLYTSSVTFQATSGTTYYIAVDGYDYGAGPDQGGIALSLGVEGSTANDDFVDRIVQSGWSIDTTGTNGTATLEGGEPLHAGNAGGASVWWTWTAVADGDVTISTAGSDFDTVLGVYVGTDVTALVEVASNDDETAGTTTSLVTFTATAGTTYQIAVDGSGGATGNIQISILGTPPPGRGGGGSCGLLGLEFLLLAALVRGRRRK